MIQTCNQYEPLKADSKVLEIQVKLNAIRNYHHVSVSGWEYLVQDGKYGPKSKRAVVAYKKYYNLTDKSDKLDAYTITNINLKYSEATTLKYCMISAPEPTKHVNKAIEVNSSYGYMNLVNDTLSTIEKTIDKMSSMIKDIINPDILTDKKAANKFIEKFKKISKELDPDLYELKQHVNNLWQDKVLVDSLSKEARRQVHTGRTNLEVMQIQKAQRVTTHTSRMIKLEDTKIRHMQTTVSQTNAQINLANKIKLKFKPNTVVATAKYIKPVAFVFSARDLLLDIFWEIWFMSFEEFKVKFKQDFYRFVDDLILGHLAEWIVLGVLYVAGITVITGGTIVLVVLGCLLVSSIIGYVLNKYDISFSEYYEEGVKIITSSICQLM